MLVLVGVGVATSMQTGMEWSDALRCKHTGISHTERRTSNIPPRGKSDTLRLVRWDAEAHTCYVLRALLHPYKTSEERRGGGRKRR